MINGISEQAKEALKQSEVETTFDGTYHFSVPIVMETGTVQLHLVPPFLVGGRQYLVDEETGTLHLSSEFEYSKEEIREFMAHAKALGFDDDWTEEEAARFFNMVGHMLAEREGE